MYRVERMKISADGSCLVPKAPGHVWSPKPQRHYNWAVDDNGRPDPQPFYGMEVPCDDWHIGLAVDGAVIVDGPEEAVRIVDQMRRNKRLKQDAKLGWNRCPPSKIKKQRKSKQAPKVPKDD
jgi:hypothetical protein